jgi:hypothetical protein
MTDQEKCELVARAFGVLMEEHGLAGFFIACAPTHSTHSLLLESAPWIRVKMVEDNDGAIMGVRILSKLDDYIAQGLTPEIAETRQQSEMAFTINALHAIATQASPVGLLTLEMLEKLRQKFSFITIDQRVGNATGE